MIAYRGGYAMANVDSCDITVKGRNTEVSERFREHVASKLAKLELKGKGDGNGGHAGNGEKNAGG